MPTSHPVLILCRFSILKCLHVNHLWYTLNRSSMEDILLLVRIPINCLDVYCSLDTQSQCLLKLYGSLHHTGEKKNTSSLSALHIFVMSSSNLNIPVPLAAAEHCWPPPSSSLLEHHWPPPAFLRHSGSIGSPYCSCSLICHSQKVSVPPLCPNWFTKRRTYSPRSVFYRPLSRQSSNIYQDEQEELLTR